MRVEPAKRMWLEELASGDTAFEQAFGIPVVPGWIGFPEALPHVVAAARCRDADPWGSYLFFDDEGALVGFGGFKGEPRDGVVEIGYAVAPQARNRGLATDAVRHLMAFAASNGVEIAVAHTLPETNASTAVLAKCGFSFEGETVDPDGGVDTVVWRWQRSLTGE